MLAACCGTNPLAVKLVDMVCCWCARCMHEKKGRCRSRLEGVVTSSQFLIAVDYRTTVAQSSGPRTSCHGMAYGELWNAMRRRKLILLEV